MRKVKISDLKIIRKINYGTYSDIYLVELCGKIYCFKQINTIYDDFFTMDRLGEMTEKKFNKSFFTPKLMVEDVNGKELIGYITEYNEDLYDIEDFTIKNQIKLLKSARNKIELLHNEAEIIHGDMHIGNILCNKKSLDTVIIDFDFSFYKGKSPYTTYDYSEAAINYLRKYKFDENLDKYLFNYSTFQLLANIDGMYFQVCNLISQDKYKIYGSNKDVKKLCKELLLDEQYKNYSGEYIIDYID